MIIALTSTMLIAADYQVNFNSNYKNLGELNFNFNNYSIKHVEKNGQTFSKINFDKNIDLWVISHPDPDHYYGGVEVLKQLNIKNIMLTGVDKNDNK